MSKKDYIAIANILKDFKKENNNDYQANVNEDDYETLINKFIRMFALDNDSFDGGRFWDYVHSDKRYKDFTDK